MDIPEIRRIRLLHMLIITLFILISLAEGLRESLPYWEFVLSIGFIWVWLLGARYERKIILLAGIADADEVKKAEVEARQWIDWTRSSNQ